MTRAQRLSLCGLLLAALAVRLAWGAMQPRQIDPRLPDQGEYVQLAQGILQGEGLAFFDERFQQTVRAYRTPGYPLFLAATRASPVVARILQALLDASTVLAVYLLARRWMEPWPAMAAGLAAAVNPFMVYFSGLLLSETLYTAMLAWGMVLLVWRRSIAWGGIVLALSVLVRPSAVLLPVLLGWGAVLAVPRPAPQRLRWLRPPAGATMLLLTVLVLLPWAWRNHRVVGKWVWLTTNGGVTRYDGFHPGATGASDQRFLQSADLRLVRRMSEVERDEYLADQAQRYVDFLLERDRVRLAKLTAWKVARTWSPVPLSDEFGRPLYMAAGLAFSVPFYMLVLAGLWRGRIPRAAKALLLMPAVYYTVVHAMTVGSLRYRLPAEALLSVLAAAGMMVLVSTWRKTSQTARAE